MNEHIKLEDQYMPSRRLEMLVERETIRQKRLLLLFGLFLLVPIGLAAYYWQFGRTDRELVRSEIDSSVAPVADAIREVQPRLEEVKNASAQIRQQTQRFERLSNDQEAVRAQVAAFSKKQLQVDDTIAQYQSMSNMLTEIRTTLDRQSARISEVGEVQGRIVREQGRIDSQLKVLDERIMKIRPMPLDDSIRKNDERLRRFEEQVNRLDQEIRQFRAGQARRPPN